MTAEWMPVNPCTPECRQRDNYCPPKSRFGCEDYHVYKGEVEYQKKLLEYLPMYSIKQGNIEGIDCWCIPKSRLIEMRKQLEAK